MANINRSSPDRTRYEISVAGRLDESRSAWFEGLAVAPQPDGTTVIEADAVDQAALHGLLRLIRDAGLQLISVTPVGTRGAPSPPKGDLR